MTRWMLTGVVGMSILSGCDSRQPTVREGVTARDKVAVQPEAGAGADPHGLAAMPPGHGRGSSIEGVREVPVGRMQLIAPEDWTRKPPRSGFLLAEFSLSRAEGDAEDARLTISAVGGGVDENIARWRGQFGGKVDEESIQKTEVAGVPITLVNLSGTYSGMHGGVGTADVQPSYRMLAAIIEFPTRQHVVKCTGPVNTVAKHADAFQAFIQSVGSPDRASSKPETAKPPPAEVTPAAKDAVEEEVAGDESAEVEPVEEESAEVEPVDEEPVEEEPTEENVSDEKPADTESR
jgi:hypothetical protein